MQKVYASFPDDSEAAAFYALAHLATIPSNTVTREHADRGAEILVRVYERNPDHPGAMHYLVHANDVPGRERELLEITRRYESIVRTIRTPSTCQRTSTRGSEIGTASSAETAGLRRQPCSTLPARRRNSCGTSSRTRSNISCMRIFSRARTRPPPAR